MNKLTKLLSVFAIAGAIGTGVAGAAGCAHKHTYEDKWTSAGAEGHYHVASCEHTEEHTEIIAHTYDDDKDTTCNDCGYVRTITPENPNPGTPGTPEDEKFKVPAETVGLVIEGVGDTEVQLSAEKKSHTIAKDSVKVYLGTGDRSNPTKGAEVPVANFDLTLRDPGNNVCTSWEGLKLNGKYTITAKLKDVTGADGGEIDVDNYAGTAQVNVKNAVQDGSLTVKTGATLSQDQSVEETMSSTWTYEVTRANEDKEDVAAKDVTVGRIDHVRAGANKKVEVSATIDGATVKGEITYTVNAVTGAVVQSKAAHFNDATLGSITTKKELVAGVYAVGTTVSKENCTIDANAKSIDGKVFANRLKLEGAAFVDGTQGVKGAAAGTEFAATALKGGRRIEFTELNKTTTAGATAKTLITVYGCSSSSGEARNLTLYKKVGTGEDAKVVVVTSQSAPGSIAKLTYVVDEAGDFFLGSESGGINAYYIQVDTILIGETGAEDKGLGGELAPVSIELKTDGVKKSYKKGETLDTTGVKVTLIKANDVTADKTEETITEGITYSTLDTTKMGPQNITVTYTYDTSKTLTAQYSVTVESDVAGVWGVEANLKSTVNTVLANASDKLTLTLGDLEGSIKGENANATVTVVSAKYGDDTAITAEGVQLSKGKYTITATVKVSDGTSEAIFENVTFEIRVSVEGEVASVEINVNNLTKGSKLESDYVIANDDLAKVTALTGCQVEANTGTSGYTARLKTNGTPTAAKQAIKVELTGKATIKVIYKKGGSDARTLTLFDNSVKSLQTDAECAASTASGTLYTYTFTAVEAGTYYLGGSGANSVGMNIFEIVIEPAE